MRTRRTVAGSKNGSLEGEALCQFIEKGCKMSTNNPNRSRTQMADRAVRYKQSGDQHLIPEDESQAPGPHRLSREDSQKFAAPPPEEPEDLQ